jgi:Cu(I)/Ag(I) efflux system periplasmic protein CusF
MKAPIMKYTSVSAALPVLLVTALTQVHAASPWALVPATADPLPFHLVHEGHTGAAQASGVVNTIDAAQRKVNVSHGSIKQLGWPAMTMDFPVSGDVDLTRVKPGMKVNFTLVKGSGGAWTVDTLKAATKQ